MDICLQMIKDKDRPFIGPNRWALQYSGMLQERHGFIANIMYYICLFACFWFIPSALYDLWLIRKDQEGVVTNLSYTLIALTCSIKGVTFLIWQKRWISILDFVSDLEKEQHAKNDDKIDEILLKYKIFSRLVTYAYRALVVVSVIFVILAPLSQALLIKLESREHNLNRTNIYPGIMSSWVPFDKTKGLGYIAICVIHSLVCIWGGGIVLSYDTTAFTIMTFLVAQFQILEINCERIFEVNSETVAAKRIKDCYKHHDKLIKHCDVLNSVLSPVLFSYVIICSIMICATARRITSESIGMAQRLWLAEYLTALVSQLFLYCWHSTQVNYSSLTVDYGVLSSPWWQGNSKLRRSILLLHGKLRQEIVFTAGPFTDLNVNTFIAVLKGSYSYYTLLK